MTTPEIDTRLLIDAFRREAEGQDTWLPGSTPLVRMEAYRLFADHPYEGYDEIVCKGKDFNLN